MTPKEKAKELVNKMYITNLHFSLLHATAKECALIAVDEILDILENKLDFKMLKSMTFWEEVKQEIENL